MPSTDSYWRARESRPAGLDDALGPRMMMTTTMTTTLTPPDPIKLTRLPPVRRIITGHDDVGQAVFEADDKLEPMSGRRVVATVTKHNQAAYTAPSRNAIYGGGLTTAFDPPEGKLGSNNGNNNNNNNNSNNGNNGGGGPRQLVEPGLVNVFRTDGLPAAVQGPWTEVHGRAIPLCDAAGAVMRMLDLPPGMSSPMHRTQSLDYSVVMRGEVLLELDSGVEKLVAEGDVVVMRGTIHAWHNRSAAMARVLFVLLPAEPVEVNGEALDPCGFTLQDERIRSST